MASPRREFLRNSATASLLVAAGHWPAVGRLAWSASGDDRPADGPPLSPFLQGDFAPVHEEITVERLEVIGELPPDLDGMFVRNGPNPQFPPKGNYHWFDGDGMLHGVRIQAGQASYRNRYVRTAGWQAEHEAGRALWTGMNDLPDLQRIAAGEAPFKNAANTALAWHDGRLLALWEAGPPHEIAVPRLDTVGPYDYGGKLRHPFTAHPKVDPETGEMLFFGYSAMSRNIRHSTVDAQGQLQRTVSVPMRRPIMMHDFAITASQAIFCDLPAVFDFAAAQRTGSMLRFDKDLGARFTCVPRRGDPTPRSVDTAGCFMFHTLNAYDDGDEVVLLGCRMDDYPAAVAIGPQAAKEARGLADGPKAVMYRWRMNFATGQVKEEQLDDQSCEFPRINEHFLGRSARYGYAMAFDMNALLKFDFASGAVERHELGPGRFGGEGVFIPRPGGKDEDDGFVATYVVDSAEQHSELVLLDARNFTRSPRARLVIPARIPFGFHGIWLDGGMFSG
ncbi:MAG: carotenoid oxygenase family protein [Pirellulales bacterium]|nr:carotenoid oxygenase family protein [Pirellulales bacterium]